MTNTPQSPSQQPPTYPGAPGLAPTPSKKPWFKKWWVWVLAVLVLAGIGNSLNPGGSSQSAAPAGQQTSAQESDQSAPPETKAAEEAKPTEKLTLDEGWEMDQSDLYAVYVSGYVTNNTDKAITNYVQITFDALDAQGANLGTCLANTNTVDAGGKWKFKAICSGEAEDISQVRFKAITGF